jgi:hypothetical protein
MATDKTAAWSDGDACLWYTPTANLDVVWSDGDAWLLDEYVAAGGAVVIQPVPQIHYYRQQMR